MLGNFVTRGLVGARAVGGVWTAISTWTLPAVTLGGAVTGAGQNMTGLGTLTATNSGTKTIWLPANGFVVAAGTPALGAADGFPVYAFDADAQEDIATSLVVPADWKSDTNMSAYIYWVSAAAIEGAVDWAIYGRGVAESEDLGTAVEIWSPAVDTTDGTAGDLNITAAGTITAAHISANEISKIQVRRRATQGADTLVGDALFLGLRITYTSKLA